MWSLKKTQKTSTYAENKNLLPTEALNKQGSMGFNVWCYNNSCHPVSFATTRGMFPDHFMRWPGARGRPCHSYHGFYLSSGPGMCHVSAPASLRDLKQGSVKYYPVMDGDDWLVQQNLASLLCFPRFCSSWPEIENGSDIATSDHLGPTLPPHWGLASIF